MRRAQPWVCYGNFARMDRTEIYNRASLYHGAIVYMGGDVAFERSFIEAYAADLVSHSHSWCKTADSMNLRARNLNIVQVRSMSRRTIATNMLKFKLIEFDLCSGKEEVTVRNGLTAFSDWAWVQYPRLLSSFMFLWSHHRTLIRSCHEKCSAAIVVDGHQKCRRRVCLVKSCSVATEEFSEPFMVGCCRTPARNSLYCDVHKGSTAAAESLAIVNRQNKQKRRRKSNGTPSWRKSTNQGFGATGCRTSKERSTSYVNKCARSFGVIAIVTNCGIVTGFSELLRSETLREIIHLFATSIRGKILLKRLT
jgi:hypothetical protein